MSSLERKSDFLASAPDEDLCPCLDWRGIPKALAPEEHHVSPHNMMGGLMPLLILLKKPKFPALMRQEA